MSPKVKLSDIIHAIPSDKKPHNLWYQGTRPNGNPEEVGTKIDSAENALLLLKVLKATDSIELGERYFIKAELQAKANLQKVCEEEGLQHPGVSVEIFDKAIDTAIDKFLSKTR